MIDKWEKVMNQITRVIRLTLKTIALIMLILCIIWIGWIFTQGKRMHNDMMGISTKDSNTSEIRGWQDEEGYYHLLPKWMYPNN